MTAPRSTRGISDMPIKVSPCKIARIEGLARRKSMIGGQDGDKRLLQNQFEYEVRVRFVTQEGDVDPSLLEVLGERDRETARHPDLDIGQFVAEDARGARQAKPTSCPVRKPMAKIAFAGRETRRAASAAASTCVSARRAWSRKARPAGVNSTPRTLRIMKRDADLVFEVAHLPAERWLRRMQAASPPQASCFPASATAMK